MNTIIQQPYNPDFCRRKIPRYIYHLTSEANYNSMLKDGFARITEDKFFVEKGLYAIELSNFFKRWGKNKSWGYEDLQRALLRQVVHWFSSAGKGKGNLVILKIPTAKLDSDKLTIRSQNCLFENEKCFNQVSGSVRNHLRGFTPSQEAPLYKRRKHAIEYIYSEDIPMKNIQRIGNIVNISDLRKDIRFGIHPVKFIMQALLEGTPELKGADLLK